MKPLIDNKTSYFSILALIFCLQASLLCMRPNFDGPMPHQPPPAAYGINLNGQQVEGAFFLGDNQGQEGAPPHEGMNEGGQRNIEDEVQQAYGGHCTQCCAACAQRYCCSCADCKKIVCNLQCIQCKICCKNCINFCTYCLKGVLLPILNCLECCGCFPFRSAHFFCKEDLNAQGNPIEKCGCCRKIESPDRTKFARCSLYTCCCYCTESHDNHDDEEDCGPIIVSCLTTPKCYCGECYKENIIDLSGSA